MGVFVLHEGQPELARFLSLLRVPSGTAAPRSARGGEPWAVLSLRGGEAGPASEGARLQPAAAVRRASDARLRAADLRRHGLLVGSAPRGTLLRTFVVPVFGLESLGAFVAGGPGGPLAASAADRRLTAARAGDADAPRSTALRRAEHAAVRAT
ncbi:MAG TPA: hypothetical protein VEZ38_03485, partial [Paenibacillus sp.]|nr:hypothetical protein [Paenibacillus sp.]